MLTTLMMQKDTVIWCGFLQGHLLQRSLYKHVSGTSEKWVIMPRVSLGKVGIFKAAAWLTIWKKDTLWLMLFTRAFGLYSVRALTHKPFLFPSLPSYEPHKKTEYSVGGDFNATYLLCPFFSVWFTFEEPTANISLVCSESQSQGRYSILLDTNLRMLAGGFQQTACYVQFRKLYSSCGQSA